jgi:hypothetical protein
MGLDAHVRCRCIQDGIAKPHPFPNRLALDETIEPFLTGDSTQAEWLIHDSWFAESCEHGGYLLSERLGNITLIAHIRQFLRELQDDPSPRFKILLTKVVFDGTHSGDWIPREQTAELLQEVDMVLQSADILSNIEKEFFVNMKRLCYATSQQEIRLYFEVKSARSA